jgi:HK97 gp10 family phage protein
MPSVKMVGAGELEDALRTLEPKVAKRVGGRALKAAGELIADQARTRVPVASGRLEDSITVALTTAKSGERKGVIGFKKGHGSRIAHLIEYGHMTVDKRWIPPQPFIRPAIDDRAEDAIALMGGILWKGIEAEARKKGKR